MPHRCEKLSKAGYYPVNDVPGTCANLGLHPGKIRAKWNGEKRPPRKGEFYLSGAKIEAYRAFEDLPEPRPIAALVVVEQVTLWQEVGPYIPKQRR